METKKQNEIYFPDHVQLVDFKPFALGCFLANDI